MSSLLCDPLSVTSHYRASDSAGILHQIQSTGVNLCIWERVPEAAWQPGITAILQHQRALSLDLTAPSREQIAEYLARHCTADADVKNSLSELTRDIANLAGRFGEIAGIKHPRVRLSRVEDEGCALFHADTLSLRLLCTYAGPGTQWVENTNLRRAELGSQGRNLEEATAAIVIDPGQIRTLPCAHVAIFKGRLAEGAEDNAWVHRSYPVRHPADFRLRLCLDLPDSCSC